MYKLIGSYNEKTSEYHKKKTRPIILHNDL